jgi:phospholipase/lecithinase/hemolysin
MSFVQTMRRLSLLTVTYVLAATAHAQPYSNLFVFGDSVTDSGNALFFTTQIVPGAPDIPPAPYFQGRFSNGYNFADDLSLRLFGQPTTASLAGGNNYAVGGATTGQANNVAPVPSGMLVQTQNFLSAHPAGADPNALYLLYGGNNDIFAAVAKFALTPGDRTTIEQDTVDGAMANLHDIITSLSSQGARHFLVPNLGDLGQLPSFIGTGDPGSFASEASAKFNAALAATLKGFPNLDVRTLDVRAALDGARAGVGGFTNTTGACYTGGITGGVPPDPCANPDAYLFWDDVHPSARADRLLADMAYGVVVPEPAAYWLMLAGLFAWLGWNAWVRRRAWAAVATDR